MPVKETHLTDAVFDQLRHAMAADPASLTALYRDYLADARESLQALHESLQAGQLEGVRAKSHYLRSSSLVLGAQQVARCAASLEEAAGSGHAAQCNDLLEKMETAVSSLQNELRGRLGSGVMSTDEAA